MPCYISTSGRQLYFIVAGTALPVLCGLLGIIFCYALASKLLCILSTFTVSSLASGIPLFAFPMLHCRSCTFPSVWMPPHWWYTSSTHYWNKSRPSPHSYRKTLCNRCCTTAISDISLSLQAALPQNLLASAHSVCSLK